MATLHLHCRVVDTGLHSDVQLNEFDRKSVGSQIRHCFLPAFAVPRAHDYEHIFRCELTRDLAADSLVRTCYKRDQLTHAALTRAHVGATCLLCADDREYSRRHKNHTRQ